MKKLSVLMFALLLAQLLQQQPDGDEPKVSFGIYETVTDSLSAIVAYGTLTRHLHNRSGGRSGQIPAHRKSVDPEGHYYAIVAVKAQPVLRAVI